MSDPRPNNRELDVDAPNESAPGHHPSDAQPPHERELDIEAPNESAPGHNPPTDAS